MTALIGGLFLVWAVRLVWLSVSAWLIDQRLLWRATEQLAAARDLHDALLQSITGLVLRFHYASETVDEDGPARGALRSALQLADTVIVESRERVQHLGLEVSRGLSLGERIAQSARGLRCGDLREIHFHESGHRPPLSPLIDAEVWHLCHEMFVHFYQHDAPEGLEIALVYDEDYFSLRCSHPPASTVKTGPPAKSRTTWRADELRMYARTLGLRLRSGRGSGNQVVMELRFPSSVAYSHDSTLAGRLLRLLRPAAR